MRTRQELVERDGAEEKYLEQELNLLMEITLRMENELRTLLPETKDE